MRKHRVSFEEATTAFGDPMAMNMLDPDHSLNEERFVLLGLSHRLRLLVVAYAERGTRTRLISAQNRPEKNGDSMKKEKIKHIARSEMDEDTMRPEYDFSKAARGVTAKRYAHGTNVVVLDLMWFRYSQTQQQLMKHYERWGGSSSASPGPKYVSVHHLT